MRPVAAALACPADGSALVRHRVSGSIVWRCPGCHGLFIPGGTRRELRDLDDLGHSHRQLGPHAILPPNPVACPAERTPMHRLNHQGVEIDCCGSCHGVWLDPGELERIRAIRKRDADPDDPADVADSASDLGDALDFVGDVLGGLLDGISL